MESKTIDIRVIRLGKWQIPRTKSIQASGKEIYLSMGYFDMIDVCEAVQREHLHFLTNAYENLSRQMTGKEDKKAFKKIMEEYTIQELVGYTNIGDTGFSCENIKNFWECNSPILFVSLIHIDCDSNVKTIIEKIKMIWENEIYLYYFSFDYSGIILLTKSIDIQKYLKMTFQLNYEKSDKGEKLVRDSYSFYGFNKVKLAEYFDKFASVRHRIKYLEKTKRYDSDKKDDLIKKILYDKVDIELPENEFPVTINIGVQNFETYKVFVKKIKRIEGEERFKSYGLLGRHDISIVKNNATLKWLVYIQFVLNELLKESVQNSYNVLFSAHETLVKVPEMGNYEDSVETDGHPIYDNARRDLNQVCYRFERVYNQAIEDAKEKETYNGNYLYAVHAVKNSLLSILKNRYAEEFVLCIYRPFIEYLEYLTKKIEEERGQPNTKSFDECFRWLFNCLDSLVNCAMHSERQFIQVTAFNAIIYDVPSKIMAFYMALIDDIKEIMRGENETQKYTFLLTPSFSNEIVVRIVSYAIENELPHDRLLKVEINEKSLYNPLEVEQVMVHEIGHYLGDKLRKRDIRKERILFSIVYIALTHILPKEAFDFEERVEVLAKEIEAYLKQLRGFRETECAYSNELKLLGDRVTEEFCNNNDIQEMIQDYIFRNLQKSKNIQSSGYMQEVMKKYIGTNIQNCNCDIMTKLIMREVGEAIEYMNVERYARFVRNGRIEKSVNIRNKTKSLNEHTLNQAVNAIVSMYKEAYADIQKILVTGICYQEYLLNFLGGEEEEWEFHIDGNIEDMGRISMVSMVMEKCGMWKYVDEGKVPQSINMNDKFYRLHIAVQRIINKVDALKDTHEIFEQFQKKHKQYLTEMKCESRSERKIKLDEKQMVGKGPQEVSFLNIRIYFELFRYLYKCMDVCVEEYSREEKKEKIMELRKIMRLINRSEDVQEVFETMNNKIKEYRDKVLG